MSTQPFAEVYKNAVYRGGDMAFSLSETPTGTQPFAGRRFAFVTAYNPRSQPLSGEENQKRHRELEREIQRLGLESAPGSGASPDGSWFEEGFILFGVGLEPALELGRRFEQHAILWGEGGRVGLAWCEDGRLEWFYPQALPTEGGIP